MKSTWIQRVQPAGYPEPIGYANGMTAPTAPTAHVVYVAGQIGWESDRTFASSDIAEQFGRALDHVVAVVRAAEGRPEDVATMTVYVTDIDAYRRRTADIGREWRVRFGRHFPAMALVAVSALVEPEALVEISAIAHVNPAHGS